MRAKVGCSGSKLNSVQIRRINWKTSFCLNRYGPLPVENVLMKIIFHRNLRCLGNALKYAEEAKRSTYNKMKES